MSINQDDLNKLSNLAKLDIPADKANEITQGLNDILGMVEQIQAADTSTVEPLANPLDAAQVLRSDAVTESNQRDALTAIAPQTEEGLFLVPKVIE